MNHPKIPRSELFYQKLIENMNEAVWMGDKDEKTIYANPKFCQLMEYELSEIIGKESYGFWDEQSSFKVRLANQLHRKKNQSSDYEGTLITKNKKKIPVIIHGTPLPDGGTIGIITDLTELKKKDSIYRQLIENMNEAVWMGDKDEKTVYANPKFCDLLGYKLEEIIGRVSYDFWDLESKSKVLQINQKHRKKGLSSTYQGGLLTKSNKSIPVLINGTPLNDGGTIGIITDLTELKQKEENEEILNNAIQYSADAIIIFDHNGIIQNWNKGAKIIFGYKKEEINYKPISKIINPTQLKENLNKQSLQLNLQLTGRHKNKSTVNISATITQIRPKIKTDNKFYLLIGRDVTNQFRFEEELSNKYEKIKEAYNQFGIIRRQMDYIFELLELTNGEQNRKNIADYIVSSVIMLSKTDACILRTYNKGTDTVDLLSSFGVDQDWQGKSTIKYKNSLLEKAHNENKTLKIIDITQEPKYSSPYLAKKSNLTSLLLIPLYYRNNLIGSLALYVTKEKKLEIFENEFIEKYARIIEIVLASIIK